MPQLKDLAVTLGISAPLLRSPASLPTSAEQFADEQAWVETAEGRPRRRWERDQSVSKLWKWRWDGKLASPTASLVASQQRPWSHDGF